MRHAKRPASEFRPPFFKTHAFRIFLSFVLFGSLLTLGYGWAVSNQMFRIHKKMEAFRVNEEIHTYLDYYAQHNEPLLTRTVFLNTYDDIEEVPTVFQRVLRALPDGSYRSSGQEGIGGPKFHRYIIRTIPERNRRLYLIFDDGGFQKRFELKEKVSIVFLYGFFLAAGLSVMVGLANARLLIHPMSRLLEQVSRSKPENLPVGFSDEFSHDEVGSLARALDQSNKRIRTFIEREKQFTRDASHELRTPVTVIKGAVELMGQLADEDKKSIQRPLKRIERSVSEMEHLIESLLQKAREETDTGNHLLKARPLVEQAVSESSYLVERKGIHLSFECTGTPAFTMSGPDFKMAVSNLIRNACAYTHSGTVIIRLSEAFIEVEDTGPGIDPAIIDQITDPYVKGESSQGHGIGLAIVKRVCDQSDWLLAIHSKNTGTRIRITFSVPPRARG